jgi:16S rRNA (guanine966-N2)-methyltransferase
MELRVIGGVYKNRNIKLNKKASARPTLVRARRIIFDTLQYKIPEQFTFLDAFAGSGINGIEALSRNASEVIFFDFCTFAIKSINENLKKMEKLPGRYSIIKTNIFKPPEGKPVDVVFLDPPYNKAFIIPDVIEKLEKYNWIAEGTIIIIEHSRRNTIVIDSKFVKFKESSVGNSIIQFFKWEKITQE